MCFVSSAKVKVVYISASCCGLLNKHLLSKNFSIIYENKPNSWYVIRFPVSNWLWRHNFCLVWKLKYLEVELKTTTPHIVDYILKTTCYILCIRPTFINYKQILHNQYRLFKWLFFFATVLIWWFTLLKESWLREHNHKVSFFWTVDRMLHFAPRHHHFLPLPTWTGKKHLCWEILLSL